MGLLVDIKSLLTTAGVSNIYLGSMPDSPDNAVALYNTGGFPRDLSGSEVEEPTFMVKVRNTSYATGETLCNTIKDALHGVNAQTVNSHVFLLIAQQGDTNDIGRDESNRQEWTINFRAYYRR
jgi:hypothetical protein